jgi:hypothetical protein
MKLFLKKFKVLFNNIRLENIAEIQMIYMQYSGEMFVYKLLFLIKEKDSNSILKCTFTNLNSSSNIEIKSEFLYLILDEYSQNIRFSHENVSLFSNPPQYFFTNKIKFSQSQILSIETNFVSQMLLSQKHFLDDFFR